jgi:hypothetical protein
MMSAEISASIVRNATADDLDGIMAVEESWAPVGRAPRQKFVARLQRFPQGFFVAEREGRIYATITSCPIHYDPADPAPLSTWSEVTNDGFLLEKYDYSACNALYIVSGIIDKSNRGKGIFAPLVRSEAGVARALGLKYVVAGAFIPGYASYCAEHGDIPAAQYAFLRRGKRLVDPLLQMYSRLGFAVPDPRHIVKDYFPDVASRNYAALVVRKA